jgi:D-alanyl-D-alanine carboxypeptidase
VSYRFPVADLRAVLSVTAVAVALVAAPAAAQDEAAFVAPDTYLGLFDDADLRGIVQPDDEIYDLLVEITGRADLDARIRAAAEARGYVRRPVASVELVTVDGREIQGAAAEAWIAMKSAARADGISLVMTSAHRDLDDQATLFRRRLGGGTSDAAIDRALRTSAPPGYSKHHSGYAVDIGEAGASGGFVNTRAYRWLSDFDFARAKSFGFVPSYPKGGDNMGPDPEAWEFVWVGAGRIACASDAVTGGFCDLGVHPRADDVTWLADRGVTVGCAPGRFCPDDPITRGEAASLLWRLHGAPPAGSSSPFVDVYASDHFRPAVDWLWSVGVVTGTSFDTFSPDDFLRPDEGLALVLRLASVDDRPDPAGMLAAAPAGVMASPVLGDLGGHIDRAEFASLLRAVAAAA